MLINKEKVLRSPRLCQAVFGMSRDEIERLVPTFSGCLVAYRYQIKPDRQRKVGGGRKGDLPTDLDKLLYTLMYLKIYPTYDVLSVLADHQRSKCGDSVQLFLPVLRQALGRELVLPKRKAASLAEVFSRCPELKDIFLDGTERRTQKPRRYRRRNKLFSGKQKSTTRKTVLVSDEQKRILFMSPTKSGRRHDKRVADKFDVVRGIPPDVAIWTDTGFQGIQEFHPNAVMPDKACKDHPLTDGQKQNNRVISGLRAVNEHAIAGCKHFKAAADVYRNRLANFDDLLNITCAGLWNFHLGQTV